MLIKKSVLPTEDQQSYKTLATSLKNVVTEEAFIRVKAQLELLIKRQCDTSAKSLMYTLRFWEKVESRWAQAYKKNFHNTAQSSLAEAAQASMKAANDTSAALVDAVYYITDSAHLEAKWENCKNGEISTGRGPMPVELSKRSSRRQIGRAKCFIEENETTNESFNPSNTPTSNSQPQPQQTSPMQPPKSKRKRPILVESMSFQKILRKAKEIKKLVCISKLSKNNNCAEVEIKHGGTRYTVVIGNQFSCDCSS